MTPLWSLRVELVGRCGLPMETAVISTQGSVRNNPDHFRWGQRDCAHLLSPRDAGMRDTSSVWVAAELLLADTHLRE